MVSSNKNDVSGYRKEQLFTNKKHIKSDFQSIFDMKAIQCEAAGAARRYQKLRRFEN